MFFTIQKNMTTYILSKTDEEIRGKSFAYVILKKIIGEEKGEEAISKVCFTKDKKVLNKRLHLYHSKCLTVKLSSLRD